MAYCHGCGEELNNSANTYCENCSNDIVGRARGSINQAESDEKRRMYNDRQYAHDWLQDVIGWILDLIDFIGIIFSGGCYLTTVIVKRRGLDDKSYEMQNLREFREKYLRNSKSKLRRKMLQEYNIVGPYLINWINSRYDSEKIWQYVSKYIDNVLDLIDKHEYKKAYYIFLTRTLKLKRNVLLSKHLR